MTMVAAEFPRPVRLDTLGDAPHDVTIEAEADERAALARRFGLIAIDRLSATAALHRQGDAVLAKGRVTARVVQRCVATGDPLPADVDAPFTLRFEPGTDGRTEEVELSADELDVLSYSGGAVDLGEAAAETLALALDPFPRAADADARLRAAGVKAEGEEERGAFAALAALKDRL